MSGEPMVEAREAELLQEVGNLKQERDDLKQQLAGKGTPHQVTAYVVLFDKTTGQVFPVHLPNDYGLRTEMARVLRLASAAILEGLK